MNRFILLASALLAGCAVGPDYVAPAIHWPAQWQSAGDTGSQSITEKAPVLDRWWQHFHDPLLNRLLELARTDNPGLGIAYARIDQARAEWRANRADLFPRAGANVAALGTDNFLTRSMQSQSQSQSQGVGALFLTGFDAIWEIDLFGRLHRKLEAADAHTAQSMEAYRQEWVVLAAEIARVYTQYRNIQAQERITQSNLEVQQKTLALTHSLFEEGVGNRFDVERAAAEVDGTAAALPLLQGQLAGLEFQLEQLLGMKPGGLHVRLAQPAAVPFAEAPELLLSRPSETLRLRPDILAAEKRLMAATATQGAALAELFPKVSIAAFAGFQNSDLENLFRSTAFSWASGSAIMQPVFNFGRIRAGIDLADARQREALLAYEESVLRALQEAETAMAQWLKEAQRCRKLEQSVQHLQEALTLADLRYQEGVSAFLDVLDAQRILYVEEVELAETRARTTLYLIALYKALGGDGQIPLPVMEEPLRPWG